MSETIDGVRYHFFSGIGRGIVFTRHGLFGEPLQFLPTTVPKSARGNEINAQMMNTTTIVPKGIAASDRQKIAIVLSTKPIPKHRNGNNDAVSIIDFIQFLPANKIRYAKSTCSVKNNPSLKEKERKLWKNDVAWFSDKIASKFHRVQRLHQNRQDGKTSRFLVCILQFSTKEKVWQFS